MKRKFLAMAGSAFLLAALLSFVSCSDDGDIWYETITVHNNSDHDVTDLRIMWDGFGGGTLHGLPHLDVLRKGEKHTFTAGVSYFSGQQRSERFGAYYTMDGWEFVPWTADKGSYVSINTMKHTRELKEGFPGHIYIENDGYTLGGGVEPPPSRPLEAGAWGWGPTLQLPDRWPVTITVRNNSAHDVADLVLGFDAAIIGDGARARLGALKPGESRELTVEFHRDSENVTRFAAAYTLNGKKFDERDDQSRVMDWSDWVPSRWLWSYGYAEICIGNEGYTLGHGIMPPRWEVSKGISPVLQWPE